MKSSSTDKIVRPGQHVPFQFVVTNTGQVSLTGVTITDALTAPASAANLGPITCGPERTPNGSVTLAAGAAVTCTATYTVSKADYHNGSLRNTATATGTPPDGPAPVSPESTITIPVKGKLPVTGTSFPAGLWMGAGVLAVLLGAALLLVVRQRRIRA
nr:LPXTG cell wall anchor domain-containing protein [Micromonospora hortensis]